MIKNKAGIFPVKKVSNIILIVIKDMLEILTVIKDMLEMKPSTKVSKNEFYKGLNKLVSVNSHIGQHIACVQGKHTRYTTKAILRKY